MITETYIPLLNSPATNLFGQIDVREEDFLREEVRQEEDFQREEVKREEIKREGDFNIELDSTAEVARISHGDLTVHFEGYHDLKAPISIGVHKLFDILMCQLTKQNGHKTSSPDALVKVSLDDYMALTGIRDTKSSKDEARKAIKNYLDTLSRISLEWTEEQSTRVKTAEGNTVKRKVPKIYSKQKLLENCSFEKGVIRAEFSMGIVQYLVNHSFITQYPVALLRLDNRKIVAYYLGKKLCYHYGLMNNVHRQCNDLISVKSLVKATPVLSPDRRELSHWKRDILAVFEKSMDTLKGERIIDEKIKIIDDWRYCLAKRQPISDTTAAKKTYDKFSELYVDFKIDSFPLPTPKQQRFPKAS